MKVDYLQGSPSSSCCRGLLKRPKVALARPQAVYFVRYAHEMNGVWFPWAQQPSAYRASFAAVAGWFRAASCGAMMLWAPNWCAFMSTTSVDKHICPTGVPGFPLLHVHKHHVLLCSPPYQRHCFQQGTCC